MASLRFIKRVSMRQSRSDIILLSSGVLFSTGFAFGSYTLNMHPNDYILAQPNNQRRKNRMKNKHRQLHHQEENDDHFHLLSSLQEFAPKIDASILLTEFLGVLQGVEDPRDAQFSSNYVMELFEHCGVDDEELTTNLLSFMDWNKNGQLTKYEVAALFTLFNEGTDVQRYKFLFQCLDLDGSGTVYKDEFRQILTCLLEAKYHMFGLSNKRVPDEIYRDIGIDEYHTMAKFAANQLTRKIFTFADQRRRGKLSWTEFLHWCYRGGNEVMTLKELLYQSHDDSSANEVFHPYRVGHMPPSM